MKDLRPQLEARLEGLLAGVPVRQRPLLFIGLGLLVLLLVWLVLLAPLASSREDLHRQIADREADLAWMRAAAQEVRQLAGDPAGTGNAGRTGSPLAAIDGSARQLGLGQALQRVEPAGSREVRVWLESAVFDDLVRWLARLRQEHGIEVAEIVIEPDRTGPGLVSARLTLVREE